MIRNKPYEGYYEYNNVKNIILYYVFVAFTPCYLSSMRGDLIFDLEKIELQHWVEHES